MKQEFYFRDMKRTVYNKIHYLNSMDGLLNSYLESRYFGKLTEEIANLTLLVSNLKSPKGSTDIYYIHEPLQSVFKGSYYNTYVPDVGEDFYIHGKMGIILESIYSASDDTMMHYTDITNEIINESDSALEMEMKKESTIKKAQELIDKYTPLLKTEMLKNEEEIQKAYDDSKKKWWKFW